VYCEVCPLGLGDSRLGCDPTRQELAALPRVEADNVSICALRRLREERYDRLTGLMTEPVLLDQVQRYVGRNPETSALIGFADGDRVKEANDTHGHSAGDRSIFSIGSEITQSLRINEALVARRTKGSDEFIFVVFGVDQEAAREITDRLKNRLASIEVTVHDIVISVGATIAVKYLKQVEGMEAITLAIHETDMIVNALKEPRRK
jgi:diguanylate cyclase (GGDEF)-like protein